MGIVFPPSIFLLEFKSREELMLQPQTAAEHENYINDDSSSSSSSNSSTSSSSSSSSDSESDGAKSGLDVNRLKTNAIPNNTLYDKRRQSNESIQSLNLTSVSFIIFC